MRKEQLYSRSVSTEGLFELVEKKGGNPHLLAAEVGLNSDFKSNDIDFISWNKVCDYLELCAKRLDAPSFGIEWAQSLPDNSRNSGPLILAGAVKNNFRDALELALNYQKIHTNGVSYSFIEDPTSEDLIGYVDIHPLSAPARQHCEHIMAHIVILASRYAPDFKIKHISFQHNAPKDSQWHGAIFPCEITYNADRNTITGNKSILDVPKSAFTTVMLPLLRSYLDRRRRKVNTHGSITMDVAELLPNMFGLQQSHMSDVALAMQISEKKLQRLLREENTTFSAILNDVRRNTATRLLQGSEIPITRIARMLDYGSVESFNAACQRWHKLSPRQVRNGDDETAL